MTTKMVMMFAVALVATGCAAGSEDTTASLTSAIKTGAGETTAETTATDAGRPHGHRKPPEEAFTACESKAVGDACTVTHDDHTITGTCTAAPADAEDTRIHCRPDHMPEGGGDCPGKGAPTEHIR